MQCWIAQSYRT
ncbi:hypothetical protein MTR67_018058 [Solanum verrucosum]|uniref:Uncharacterized protein n=1 Tax=Solanum verrucosum TaxID=315347 RepID=A0AAF0QKA3_SOLVR|nr:hypothetical protein MTR67_018058 [Solanum verrucosum]